MIEEETVVVRMMLGRVWGSGLRFEGEGRKDLQVEFLLAALGGGALIGDRFLSGIVGKRGRIIGNASEVSSRPNKAANAQCRVKELVHVSSSVDTSTRTCTLTDSDVVESFSRLSRGWCKERRRVKVEGVSHGCTDSRASVVVSMVSR